MEPEPDPSPSKSEAQDIQSSGSSGQPSVGAPFVDPPPTKNIPPFPEPRVPYPLYSSLTALEQDTYVKMMIKFINSTKNNLNVLQMKEYNHYEVECCYMSLHRPHKFLECLVAF